MSRARALLVSGAASGQGKTTLTLALALQARGQGLRVRVFKTGADFLDPQLMAAVLGQGVEILDLWMCGEPDLRARLHEAATESDLLLIEGVMGLHDGSPSSADLARALGVPVALVIDAGAMAGTFGAIAQGLTEYEPDLTVAGVIANRVGSPAHAQMLKDSLRGLRWLGHLPRDAALALPERHLGLINPTEIADLDERMRQLRAAWVPAFDWSELPLVEFAPAPSAAPERRLEGRRIAIAQDAAFCFAYPANLALLEALGARLCPFSPIAGERLPDCDAVWLPGGWPELHLDALARNTALFGDLRLHCDAGKPLLAECGGMLTLLDGLTSSDDRRIELAGLLRGEGRMGTRLAGLGLQAVDLPEGEIRGHSFHWSSAEIDQPPLCHASNPNDGPTREPVWRMRAVTASYVHLYFPSNPDAVARLFGA